MLPGGQWAVTWPSPEARNGGYLLSAPVHGGTEVQGCNLEGPPAEKLRHSVPNQTSSADRLLFLLVCHHSFRRIKLPSIHFLPLYFFFLKVEGIVNSSQHPLTGGRMKKLRRTRSFRSKFRSKSTKKRGSTYKKMNVAHTWINRASVGWVEEGRNAPAVPCASEKRGGHILPREDVPLKNQNKKKHIPKESLCVFK